MLGKTMAHRPPAQRSWNMQDRRRKAPQLDLFANGQSSGVIGAPAWPASSSKMRAPRSCRATAFSSSARPVQGNRRCSASWQASGRGVRERSSRRAPVGFTSPLMAANRGYGQGCRIARRYLGKCPFFDQDHILRFVNTGANFLNMTEHRLVHCVRSTKTSFDISCSGLIYRKDAMWIIP